MDLSDNSGILLPPVGATFAWVLFGLCFSLLFYGVMLCQAYWYFQMYQEDPRDLKITVAAILIANAVNLALIMHTCYFYAVGSYAAPDAFNHISSSLVFTPISIFICILLCEYVYVRRTYLILPPIAKWVFIMLAVLVVVSATAFITTLTVRVAMQPTFEQWLKFKWLVCATFGCATVGDLGLAVVLSLALHVSRTGFKRTDVLLNSIIINAFRTGTVTSLLSVACLLVAVFEGKNVVIIPLSIMVAKIYANATLVTLNIRRGLSEKLRPQAGIGSSDMLSLSAFDCAPRWPSGERERERSEDGVAAVPTGSRSTPTLDSTVYQV